MSGDFRSVFYTSSDGLRLHARVYGSPAAGTLPIVCLPGLSRNARDFHALALMLAGDPDKRRRVIAFDYRGRGLSEWDADWRNYTVAREATDIEEGLAALGVERAAFIGTSRGGLIAMTLAAQRPALVRAVVLNDIGPVIESAGLAHIRGYLDGAEQPRDFSDAVRLMKAVHGEQFPALGEADWQRQAHAVYRMDDGRPVADYDPALLIPLKSADLDQPRPDLWPLFQALAPVPLLAIRGANSPLLSEATLAEMTARHPDIETVVVEGQGHPPLLETGNLPLRIAAFLARAEAAIA
jgi:pimeloyl-ACP methyl ester carboxylesterase